ncbi:MAG TPA: M15 family metallopeptidase [Candidatus Saccharimonadales bacterium]|nr:M15 family metallopeptidase [Candidatus Saccharimonadales bacterium]
MSKNSKRPLVILIVALIIVVACTLFFFSKKAAAPETGKTGAPTSQADTASTPSFNKKQYSTTDPTSMWVIVNKQHQLDPKDYVPSDLVFPNVPLRVPGNESMKLRSETATALEQLIASAKNAGFNLMLASGYRSYNYQVGLYGGYVKSLGQSEADKTSARPGHSEHQTGLALDVEPATKECELEQCFGTLPEGKWIAEHAYEYGFIVRYPADKIGVTGYEYEPWHLRYIGKDLAAELHAKKVTTLEEFFGVNGGTSY